MEESKIDSLENNILNEKSKIDTLRKPSENKIISWFKDPYNLALLGIMLLAIGIRISYFILTKNQPLWWDEAEYMLKAKNIAFGTPDTGWAAGLRPILFSFISAIFLKLGLGEIGLRFLWAIMSIFNVYFVYYLGKNLIDKKVGLIAALLMACSYIELFYAFRLLVDLPEVFFILLALVFFINSEFLGKSKKYIWLVLPILLLGTLIRFTVGLGIIILLLYLLFTRRLSLFKEKEWYISLAFGFLIYIPYGLYSWKTFGNPFSIIISTLIGSSGQRSPIDTPMHVLMTYIQYLPSYTNLLLYFAFLIALVIIIFKIIFAYGSIGKIKSSKINLLLILNILVPLFYFGLFVNHFEDRYLAMALPFMFILIGFSLNYFYLVLRPYTGKAITLILIIALVSFGAYQMYSHSESIIKDKLTSYDDLRKVGIWIKDNSNKNESILSGALPELTYYSERAVYINEQNITAELDKIAAKNVGYIVVSSWENEPEWLRVYLSSNQTKFEPVYQSVSDYHGQQTYAVVFKT